MYKNNFGSLMSGRLHTYYSYITYFSFIHKANIDILGHCYWILGFYRQIGGRKDYKKNYKKMMNVFF